MTSGFITLRATFSGVKSDHRYFTYVLWISKLPANWHVLQLKCIKRLQPKTHRRREQLRSFSFPALWSTNSSSPSPSSSPTCRAKTICQASTGYWDFSFCWSNSEAAQKLLLCHLNKNQWKCCHDWLSEEIQNNQALLLSHRSSLTAGITNFTLFRLQNLKSDDDLIIRNHVQLHFGLKQNFRFWLTTKSGGRQTVRGQWVFLGRTSVKKLSWAATCAWRNVQRSSTGSCSR